MAQQQVGCLEVTVQDPVVVQVLHATQQLDHQRLHLPWMVGVTVPAAQGWRLAPHATQCSLHVHATPHAHTVPRSVLFLPQDTAHVGAAAPGPWPTWQERLLHGLHQALEVVLHIVHHNVDLVHVAAHNYFLGNNAGPLVQPPSSPWLSQDPGRQQGLTKWDNYEDSDISEASGHFCIVRESL